jgi:hypothetical protein
MSRYNMISLFNPSIARTRRVASTDLLVLFTRVGLGLESLFRHLGRVRLGGHVGSGGRGGGGVCGLGKGAYEVPIRVRRKEKCGKMVERGAMRYRASVCEGAGL